MKVLIRLIVLPLICFATTEAPAQQKVSGGAQMPVRQQTLRPEKLVTLGDFLYRNNDVTDLADSYYRQAINKAPTSEAAGHAQYNRGGYWFRKYYLLKEQLSKEDRSALTEAEAQYYDFIDKFARQTKTVELLSDAHFYLALVYLQQGKRDYAIGWLNRMIAEAEDDKDVYVYQVIWSSNAADTIDRRVDAEELAKFARSVIAKGYDFNSTVNEIKRWCKRQ